MNRTLMTLIVAALLLPTASHGQTPPGDRYVCYKAALAPKQPKFNAVQKTLQDQLDTLVADVKGFTSLCNPALSALHPTVHQVGYKMALAKTTPPQAKFVKSDHTAFDQFGSHLTFRTSMTAARLRISVARTGPTPGQPSTAASWAWKDARLFRASSGRSACPGPCRRRHQGPVVRACAQSTTIVATGCAATSI